MRWHWARSTCSRQTDNMSSVCPTAAGLGESEGGFLVGRILPGSKYYLGATHATSSCSLNKHKSRRPHHKDAFSSKFMWQSGGEMLGSRGNLKKALPRLCECGVKNLFLFSLQKVNKMQFFSQFLKTCEEPFRGSLQSYKARRERAGDESRASCRTPRINGL